MDSKRQQKMARLLKEELSTVFQKDAQHLFGNSMITLTTVRVTPDMGIARVYVSVLTLNNQTNKEEVIAEIEDNTKQLRQMLGQRIRHTVRIIPELQFFLDDTAEYAAKMDALIDSLNIPPADDDDKK
ncbi:MAG: 30S ribosome-binding factor RbfA [Microscillaceae bacterium]|jgi:ribosome-binding factor A|nr:30S ribosome-binding factor RbfA [Microscillaceae bacterium]